MSTVESLQLKEAKISEAVTLTSAAVEAVQELFAQQELEGYALRVFIQGGGCSGVQFGMSLENNIRDTDTIFDSQGVQVVVDNTSLDYWRGATIDFVDNGLEKGFKIDNPNPVSNGCGCGSNSSAASSDNCGDGSCGCS
jgi:iron-sulfur cluster assembly accessory protein